MNFPSFYLLQGRVSNAKAASQAKLSEEPTTPFGYIFYHTTLKLDIKKALIYLF